MEKVLDSKWFKMEREMYPPGVDPDSPSKDDEEEDEEAEEDEVMQACGS